MITVIGGGLAGLGAAYRLRQAGQDVTVFEANDRLGGLAATYDTAGDPIEVYYHHLSRSEQTIVDVIEDLGLAPSLEWRIGKNAYYIDGTVHPLDTPWQIAAYPHLSLYDKFRLGMLTMDIDVSEGRPKRGYDDLAAYDTVPIRSFIERHTTPGVYRSFFEPLLRAKFGDRMEEVSAAWLLGRVKFRSERDILRGEVLGYLEGGFHQLTTELAEAIGPSHLHTATRVVEVNFDHDGVSSVTVDGPAGQQTYDTDGVVFATMPHVLEQLTGHRTEIDFQGTVCSLVAMEESLLDTYWLNIAEDVPFGALIEHTQFVPPTRYGDEHLLYVARYVQDHDDELWSLSDEAVEARWLSAIEDLFPRFDRTDIRWIKTARNPYTAPVYDVGYLDHIVPYDLADAVAPGIYYAGMASRAQYPERSLNGALEAGFAAAEHVLDRRTDASSR